MFPAACGKVATCVGAARSVGWTTQASPECLIGHTPNGDSSDALDVLHA